MKKVLLLVAVVLAVSALLSQENHYEAGKAVIKLKQELKPMLNLGSSSTGIAEVDDLLRRLQISSVRPRFATNPKFSSPIDLSLILELSFDRQREPLGICNALARLAAVEYAEPIYIDTVLDIPSDYYYPYMRYFDALQAESAWSIHKGENGSSEVVIAIVDTGVNWKHPDMVQNIWQNLGEDANGNGYTIYYNGSAWVYDPGDLNGIDDDGNGKIDDLIGWDFMNNPEGDQDNDPYDSSGHGTNVSGIANARTNNAGIGVASVAWNVKTMPISCSFNNTSIYRGYDAIIYAAETGAKVINCSWGGIYPSQANQAAVNYAWSLGSVIVAASGNSNNTIPLYPSAYQNVVAVALVRNSGVHTVATYGVQVDVCAPIDSIYTTVGNSYGYVSPATSYACPIASSLIALIWSYNPTWTNAQVVAQLTASCDDVNPYNPAAKQNLLGYGRLNAYQALSETGIVPTPGLKLAVQEFGEPSDTNGNKAIEPGEQFSLNFVLRNYAILTSASALNITLSCSDASVSILNNSFSGSIGADGILNVEDAFLIQVSPTATAKYVTFYLNCSAEVPILVGSQIRYDVLLNAPGIFIWEGYPNSRNMSGTYLRDRLVDQGYACALGNNYNINGTLFPPSLHGFDAVFLSFGIVGGNIYRLSSNRMFDAIRNYLEEGGKLYIEGGDVIARDIAVYFPEVEPGLNGDDILWPLLGIAAADDGATNALSSLSGEQGWLTLDLLFTASSQTQSQSMDKYTPNLNGLDAFIEDDYGTVAVQSLGAHNQRVFLMSYALRELVDGQFPHTRLELLNRILAFFFAGELLLPAPRNPTIEVTAPGTICLFWEYPFAVDQFTVYAADSPQGIYTPAGTVSGTTQICLPAQQRRFFKVIASRVFGLD